MGSYKETIKAKFRNKSKFSLLNEEFRYSDFKKEYMSNYSLSLLEQMRIYNGHQIPKSIEEANANFKLRRQKIVRSIVLKYAAEEEKFSKEADREEKSFPEEYSPFFPEQYSPFGNKYLWARGNFYFYTYMFQSAIPKIIAGLYVFSHQENFSQFEFSLLSGLPNGSPVEDHKDEFVDRVSNFFARNPPKDSIAPISVGTKGDFDFVLRQLITLVYLFKDHSELLSNDIIYNILTRIFREKEIPCTGQDPNEWLYLETPGVPIITIHQTETENHVLMINCWRYLVQNYLEWAASPYLPHKRGEVPRRNPRYDPRLKAIYNSDINHYKNTPELADMILQILGRVVHNGMFETNSKPYETYSTLAILALYSFSSVLFPQDEARLNVKRAARNALDYLAAKFAFQGFEGKRYAPMRRNYDYKSILDFYEHDHFPNLFGTLSGWYIFPDIDGKNDFYCKKIPLREDCPYHFRDNGKAAIALFAALSDYQIPDVIHDFMLNHRQGWWARMQSRFTKDHYTYASDDPKAKYFNKNESLFMEGEFKPVPQVYFITKDFANIAGGVASKYYTEYMDYDFYRVYHVLSKPTILLTKGRMRFKPLNPEEYDDVSTAKSRLLENMSSNVILMPGDTKNYHENTDFAVYKSFAFCVHQTIENEWPHHYPESWNNYLKEEFKIWKAEFRIFQFQEGTETSLEGYYLIFTKIGILEGWESWQAGFWEIVPIKRYTSPTALKSSIIENNPGNNFTRPLWYEFKYKMTTGDSIDITVEILGSSASSKITRILDKHGVDITSKYHFNIDEANIENLRNTPLVDVWEVDENYDFTGRKYASNLKSGLIEITNPFISKKLILDSSDYKNPKRKVQTYH